MDLETRVEQLEAYTRVDNLIIHGIPESYAEKTTAGITADTVPGESVQNTESAVLQLFSEKLSLNLSPADISVCHRLKKLNQKAPFRPVIVRFTNRKARSAVLAAKKRLRQRQDCGGIYINEHLTNAAGKLFATAREVLKNRKIGSAWTWNGRVYIKLLDEQTILNIKSAADLQRFM